MLNNLRISFEIECFVNTKKDLMILLGKINRTDLAESSYRELFEELPKAILDHLDFITGFSGWSEDPMEGSIDIEDDSDGYAFSFELIPPILSFADGVRCLRSAFAFIKESGLKTNKSCGLHVNVSYDGIEDIDPFLLVNVLDEELILETFDRIENHYCVPFSKRGFNRDQLTNFIARSEVTVKKNCSVNFDKLLKGYLEFRMIGGTNYHTNKNVFWAIDEIIESLHAEMNYRNHNGKHIND